jgi:hypothetical protein
VPTPKNNFGVHVEKHTCLIGVVIFGTEKKKHSKQNSDKDIKLNQ